MHRTARTGSWRRRWLALAVAALLLVMAARGVEAWMQGEAPQRRLEIAALDVAQFPEVGVSLIVTDRQSRPVRELQAARLRESGVPIADYEVVLHTAGTELYLVVDANSRIQEADDESGTTRLQKVKDSMMAYGGRFMDLAGRDRVTVIVPSQTGARLLAERATLPAQLIEAIRPYDAGRLPESSVTELLALALEQAAAVKNEGRFQAVVLYTDGAGLNEARLEPLVERAQALQIPIFVLLLGGGATPNENAVQAATALAAPSRGFVTPMPAASDSSDVFQVIADNGVQSQLRYRSNVRQSGAYSLTVTLENLRDEATLALELAPPQVRLEAPETIERAGTVPDAPLDTLQPEMQPLVAEISWPDGLPRKLQGASLLADGRAQEAPFFGGEGVVHFDWRIAQLEAGRYDLTVVVTDTLGMRGQSATETVTIVLARPEALPTPSPAPTPEPLAALRELLPPLPARAEVEALFGPLAALAAFIIVVLATRWLSRRKSAPEEPPPDATSEGEEAQAVMEATGERAYLELLGGDDALAASLVALAGGNVTIGSAEGKVQLHLGERSISGLHARIRRRGAAYWLYDEGSEHGTFLNHERLGLAPKQLRDGDAVQLGRLRMRFRIVKDNDGVAHVGREEDHG